MLKGTCKNISKQSNTYHFFRVSSGKIREHIRPSHPLQLFMKTNKFKKIIHRIYGTNRPG